MDTTTYRVLDADSVDDVITKQELVAEAPCCGERTRFSFPTFVRYGTCRRDQADVDPYSLKCSGCGRYWRVFVELRLRYHREFGSFVVRRRPVGPMTWEELNLHG